MEKELLIEKAHEGYTVCYAEQCPLRQQCLRWQVGQYVPDTASTCRCVNLHYAGVATEGCPMYRDDRKVRFAIGMTQLFTSDMPRRVENEVRQRIIWMTNRTYYYEYRNGTRLIPPKLQQDIRDLFRDSGWACEVTFDGYVEDYNW